MAFSTLAVRSQVKIRLAIQGTSGSGKTLCALLIAAFFGKRIAVIDSEQESAKLYVGLPGVPPFSHEPLPNATIAAYLHLIGEAAAGGFEVLLIDGISAAWSQVLEAVDRMGGWVKAGKTMSPMQRRLVDAILNYPGHVIVTVRSKTEWTVEKNDQGKNTMKKLGIGPIDRPQSEYDYTAVLDLDRDGTFTVSKSRCGAALPMDAILDRNTDIPRVAANLRKWIDEGAPLSAAEELTQAIKFAATDAALSALRERLLALKDQDIEGARACLALYKQRKAEFQNALPPPDDADPFPA